MRSSALASTLMLVLAPLTWSSGTEAAPAPCAEWTPIGASAPPGSRTGVSSVLDPSRRRALLFGGFDTVFRDELWSFDLDGSSWSLLTPAGVPPSPRDGVAMIYDPPRDRVLCLGGNGSSGFLFDLWELSLSGTPAWTELAPAGVAPTKRFLPAVAYDSSRDRLIVIGGMSSSFSTHAEVWELSLAGTPTWTPLATSGPTPAGRYGHVAAYDPIGDRVVVYGGRTASGVVLEDAWQLALGSTTWSALSPGGDAPEHGFTPGAAFDASRAALIVTGGYHHVLGMSNRTFALSLAGAPRWFALAGTGTLPTARAWHAATLDPATSRMMIFGGQTSAGPIAEPAFADVGSRALAVASDSSTGVVVRSPEAPCHATGATVTLTAHPMPGFVFDGWEGDASGAEQPLTVDLDVDRSIVARFVPAPSACEGWSPLGAPEPSARRGVTAIHDPIRQRMIVFGGHTGSFTNETWAVGLDEDRAWTPLATAGTPPSPRDGAPVVYDPLRDRMIVLGGNDGQFRSDLWELTLGALPTWSPLVPVSPPPASRNVFLPSVVYDAARDRLLVFGGILGETPIHELWAVSLSGTPQWTQIFPAGEPPSGRYGHSAVYDPDSDRMIVYGGDDAANVTLRDVWAVSLSGIPVWSRLEPSGTPHTGGFTATMALDSARRRLVLFGGHTGDLVTNEVTTLSLAHEPFWTRLATGPAAATPRAWQAGIYDSASDQVVVFGGQDAADLPMAGGAALAFGGSSMLAIHADPAAGFVSADPGSQCHAPGDPVQLTASARSGYLFSRWHGDATGSTNPLPVVMDRSKAIVAVFAPVPLDAGTSLTPRTGFARISPNPAVGVVRLEYALASAGRVRLAVFDAAGRRVTTLVDGERPAGAHAVAWDGRAARGRARAGVYFARLESAGTSDVRRFALTR